jgi:hypothetical protein
MARTVAELAYTTQNDLLSGFINSLLKTDQLTAALIANAAVTDRPAIQWNKLASVPTPVYADCTTELTSQAISGTPMTVNLLTMAVQFNACQIGQNLYSSFTDVLASEVEGALIGMSHKILAGAVGSGNGSTAIYGLDSVDVNTVACAVSASPDVSDFDALLDAVKDKNGGVVIAGSPLVVRKVVKELRSEAAMQWQELAGTTLNTPSYRGYNIVSAEGLDDTKLFAFSPAGYKLFMGTKEDQEIGGLFGFQDLGNSQTKLEKLYRIYCHIAGVSLNPQGIASLTGVV